MSVTLSPMAPRYAVSDADDPFKKYWWAILMGIVFTALWLVAPMLGEKPVGSTVVDTSPKPGDNVEQSLSTDAGSGIDLSMDGAGGKKKEEGPLGSSLYQAPPEEAPALVVQKAGAAAAGSVSGAAPVTTLASELKKVGESTGGWGEKAQRGFAAPALAGGSLSGMSAAGGGKAGSAGTAAFGSNNANVSYSAAKGFSGGAGGSDGGNVIEGAPEAKGMSALQAAAAKSSALAANRSGDGLRSSSSQIFDGAKAGSKIGSALAGGVAAGNYGALDAAPVNLKVKDTKMEDLKKLAPPPAADRGASDMKDSDMAKQIAMQVVGLAIGGAIGGPMGSAVSSAVVNAIEKQEAQARKVRELEDKQEQDRAARRMGLKPRD